MVLGGLLEADIALDRGGVVVYSAGLWPPVELVPLSPAEVTRLL